MKKGYSALELFGGKKRVLEKMNSILRKDLLKTIGLDENKRRDWCEAVGFPSELQEKVYNIIRGEEVDCYTLRMIGESAGIDIYATIENPKFTTKSREYWLNQIKENPMVIGGKPPSGKISKEAELRFYVRIRAIGEVVMAA